MKTLLINTCTNRIIVAIADENTVFSFFNEIVDNQMSNIIMNYVEKCFSKANMIPNDIDKVLIAVGPGSYTGIRIGVTIAKTFAWSLKKEIVPVSALEMMISGYDTDKLLIPYINARRNAVFAGYYDSSLNSKYEDEYITLEKLQEKLFGEDYIFVSDDDLVESELPKLDVLKLVRKYKNNHGVNPHILNPVYLKKTEAEEKLEND